MNEQIHGKQNTTNQTEPLELETVQFGRCRRLGFMLTLLEFQRRNAPPAEYALDQTQLRRSLLSLVFEWQANWQASRAAWQTDVQFSLPRSRSLSLAEFECSRRPKLPVLVAGAHLLVHHHQARCRQCDWRRCRRQAMTLFT